MNRDLQNKIEQVASIVPAVYSAGANGVGADLRDCDSAALIASIGAIVGAGGDAAITLEESDVLGSGYTAVAASDILGTLPTAMTAATSYRFGYSGAKRYIRAVLDKGTETSVAAAIVVLKGNLAREPEGQTVAS